MKKLLLIHNPCAGTRKAGKHLADILSEFCRADWDVHVHITQGRGDGRRVARERSEQMDLVVCCGGDGTFNETVAGILEAGCKTPVGYIPAGSTNDFAGSLQLPGDPVEAARSILTGTPQTYDVGSFGGRYFTYVASFGAFTKASYTTSQSVKNALGHTAYVLSGIQELSQLHPRHVRLELDGQVLEDDFLFGAICNSTSVGGILTLDPSQVDMRDGKFEVLLVRAPKDFGEIAECIQAVQRQQYNCKMITFRSAGRITVQADAEMAWTLDGEWEPGHACVTVENIHRAFCLVRQEER